MQRWAEHIMFFLFCFPPQQNSKLLTILASISVLYYLHVPILLDTTKSQTKTGFKRITTQNDSSVYAYCHHLFQRERPNLCTKMKGDGGLRATDEERQAAAAVGIDPRRAAGIEGLTPAQLAQRQVELERERQLRKAGVDVDGEKKKKSPVPPPAYAAPAAPTAPAVPASAANGVGGAGTAVAGAVAAGATAFVHPTPSTALANEVGPLMAELEYLRRLREKKGQLQAQAALTAALSLPRGPGGIHQVGGEVNMGGGGGGSPFLRPPAASGASALAGSLPGGAMLGASSGGLVQSPSGGPLSSSTTLLDHQLRLQQQLEIEHERLYLERIRQERQLEEQRLRTIHSQQLLQQQQLSAGGVLPPATTNVFPSGRFDCPTSIASFASQPAGPSSVAAALSSPALPSFSTGGIHGNSVLDAVASSGLLTHPLDPRAPIAPTGAEETAKSGETYDDALNNFLEAKRRLIASRFEAEGDTQPASGDPSASGAPASDGPGPT
jgi:hypothetical protein